MRCQQSRLRWYSTADSIFVLQFYLCLSTITEVPFVDTVAWLRPLQTAVREPPNLQNTKTCAFLRTGFRSCVKAVFWVIVMRAGSKCSLLHGTSITGVTDLPRGGCVCNLLGR